MQLPHTQTAGLEALAALEVLAGFDGVTSLRALVAYNEARKALFAFVDTAAREGGVRFEPGSAGARAHEYVEEFSEGRGLGRGAAGPVLAQEFWLRSEAGRHSGTPRVRDCDLGTSDFKASAVLADAVLAGPHALVKVRALRRTRDIRLAEVFRASAGRDVLLLPVGVVGLLEAAVDEVVLVGELTDAVLRRAETAAALSQDDGSSLAELLEAVDEL